MLKNVFRIALAAKMKKIGAQMKMNNLAGLIQEKF